MTTENPLDALQASVAGMSRQEACAALPLIASLHAQLMVIAFSRENEVEHDDDALITVKEAAAFLHLSPSFLYDRWPTIPGATKLGGSVRFSRTGLAQYAAGAREADDDTRRDRPRGALRQVHRQSARS